jgi:uncharacterized protein YjbI with pentapeptide repeats
MAEEPRQENRDASSNEVKPLRGRLIVFAVAGAILLIVILWAWVRPTDPTEKKDFIQAVGVLLAALAGLAGLYFTRENTEKQLRQARESTRDQLGLARKSQERTQRLTEQGQITDRFTRAIEQLGAMDDDGNPRLEIRLGGIYALERIDKESLERVYHSTVMEVLTAYVRANAPWPPQLSESSERGFVKPPGGSPSDSMSDEAAEQDRRSKQDAEPAQRTPSTDIQAIFDVLKRRKEDDVPEEHRVQRLDLRGTDLRGANLLRAPLKDADLSRSHLQGASLFEAKLEGANILEADLTEANLRGANLRRADFSGAKLSEADLTEANLREANLREADLSQSYLSQSYLSQSYLREANLRGANLSGVDLSEADLWQANLLEANLRGANLRGVYLRETNLRGADLWRADLLGAHLWRADLRGANLRKADLSKANLVEANFGGADLSGVYLRETNLRRADLSGANLRGANLRGANLRAADLHDAKNITNEELKQQAYSLEGANMPDGQKYEDWLRSRDQGEDGGNSGPC